MPSKFLNNFLGPMESSCLHGHNQDIVGNRNECRILNNEMLKVTAYNIPVSLKLASRTSRQNFWFL